MASASSAPGTPQAASAAGGTDLSASHHAALDAERQRIRAIELQHGRLAALRALNRPVIVALVACSKTKLNKPAMAAELYMSPLFRLAMRYARLSADEVFILSAKYTLLRTNDWIGPYNQTMKQWPLRHRLAWGEEVARHLHAQLPGLALQLVMLAGRDYDRPIVAAMASSACTFARPLQGRGIGCQMQWLKEEIERVAREPIGVHPATTRSARHG